MYHEREDFLEMKQKIKILRKNVRYLQEQLQEVYKRIKELGEKYESTRNTT
jgi:uncharacterized coiled-coil DUF342 family protein